MWQHTLNKSHASLKMFLWIECSKWREEKKTKFEWFFENVCLSVSLRLSAFVLFFWSQFSIVWIRYITHSNWLCNVNEECWLQQEIGCVLCVFLFFLFFIECISCRSFRFDSRACFFFYLFIHFFFFISYLLSEYEYNIIFIYFSCNILILSQACMNFFFYFVIYHLMLCQIQFVSIHFGLCFFSLFFFSFKKKMLS